MRMRRNAADLCRDDRLRELSAENYVEWLGHAPQRGTGTPDERRAAEYLHDGPNGSGLGKYAPRISRLRQRPC